MPPLSPDRAGRLTASVFGAALGLSPYLSRQALWRQMTGREAPFAGNEATEWGTTHEPIAIDAYEIATGNIVKPADFVAYGDWSGATPDGYIVGGGLIEVKCPFSQKIYDRWPDHYRAQVIGQLAITGQVLCDCWCWTPAGAKVVERIWHDDGEWGRMVDELMSFYDHVKQDKEPKRAKKYQFNDRKAA